jgi:hypothetical protein
MCPKLHRQLRKPGRGQQRSTRITPLLRLDRDPARPRRNPDVPRKTHRHTSHTTAQPAQQHPRHESPGSRRRDARHSRGGLRPAVSTVSRCQTRRCSQAENVCVVFEAARVIPVQYALFPPRRGRLTRFGHSHQVKHSSTHRGCWRAVARAATASVSSKPSTTRLATPNGSIQLPLSSL